MGTPDIKDFLTPDNKLSDVWFRHLGRIGEIADDNAALVEQVAQFEVDIWSWLVEFPSDRDYLFIVNLPYAGEIQSITTKSGSGTCTFTGKINSTALGGAANSISSTEQTQAHTSANAFVIGDDFVGAVSSNSSCENMTITVKVKRTP